MTPNEEWKQKLRRSLTNITPTVEGIEKIEEIRALSIQLGERIIDLCPDSQVREKALAVTNLEQMTMWAVKSVVLGSEKK